MAHILFIVYLLFIHNVCLFQNMYISIYFCFYSFKNICIYLFVKLLCIWKLHVFNLLFILILTRINIYIYFYWLKICKFTSIYIYIFYLFIVYLFIKGFLFILIYSKSMLIYFVFIYLKIYALVYLLNYLFNIIFLYYLIFVLIAVYS